MNYIIYKRVVGNCALCLHYAATLRMRSRLPLTAATPVDLLLFSCSLHCCSVRVCLIEDSLTWPQHAHTGSAFSTANKALCERPTKA